MKKYLTSVLFVMVCSFAIAQSSSLIKGKASFYHDRFHGRTTANGEKYGKNELTCAHRTLPFDTWVKVTNQRNGKSVVVRVNDRGPYVGNRVIDLSSHAAKKIGMMRTGLAPVLVEVLDSLNPELITTPLFTLNLALDSMEVGKLYNVKGELVDKSGFSYQVNAFRRMENAVKECEYLKSKGCKNVLVLPDNINGEKMYRILVGIYPSRDKAIAQKKRVDKLGYSAFLTRVGTHI